MSDVSHTRKAAIAAGILARQVGNTRTFGALKSGAKTTGRSVSRAMGQLWIEITGFTFIAFSAIGLIALIRECFKFSAGNSTPGKLALGAGFVIMFAWFGFSSFWRVRKKRS